MPPEVILYRQSGPERAIADGEPQGFVKVIIPRGTASIPAATVARWPGSRSPSAP